MLKMRSEIAVARFIQNSLVPAIMLQALSLVFPWWTARSAGESDVVYGYLFIGGTWEGHALVDPITARVAGIAILLALIMSCYAWFRTRTKKRAPWVPTWVFVAISVGLQGSTAVVSGVPALRCTPELCGVVYQGFGWTMGLISVMYLWTAVILLNIQRMTAPSGQTELTNETLTPAN